MTSRRKWVGFISATPCCEYGCVIKQALPTGRMLIFIQAWLNEKFAPELLGYKTDIVECILEIIREMVSLNYERLWGVYMYTTGGNVDYTILGCTVMFWDIL